MEGINIIPRRSPAIFQGNVAGDYINDGGRIDILDMAEVINCIEGELGYIQCDPHRCTPYHLDWGTIPPSDNMSRGNQRSTGWG